MISCSSNVAPNSRRLTRTTQKNIIIYVQNCCPSDICVNFTWTWTVFYISIGQRCDAIHYTHVLSIK